MSRLSRILNLDDFETAARRYLPRPIFAYIVEAAETRATLAANRAAFDDWAFLPRILVDVSGGSQQATLFGRTYASPFGIAPMGISALSAYRGDLVLARVAGEKNIPMIMSSSSLIPMETLAAESKDAWFQAYLPGDDDEVRAMVERAAQAGFSHLVVTVDSQVAPNRENYARAGFSSPLRPSLSLAWQGVAHPEWLFGTFLRTLVKYGMPHFENNYANRRTPILSSSVTREWSDRGRLAWSHLKLIRDMWKGPLIVKGILSADDARLARDAGADGIVLSNHGGRQLDGAVAPLVVLPDVVRVAQGMPVMIDGGIRRGTDVLKALALGAAFVFIGRPFNYAATIASDAGVALAIALLQAEIQRDMMMLGITRLDQLGPRTLLNVARNPLPGRLPGDAQGGPP
jgi:L-lactate dehydrogenase (cytochrome)